MATHCAGSIFGRDVDNTRIGVARGVKKALIGKVLGDDGRGSSEMVFRGIQWALDRPAQVISIRMQEAGLPVEAAVSNAREAYRSNLRFSDALMPLAKDTARH